MRNFRQAPKLYHSQEKEKKNTYMLPQKLMDSVFNQLDGKHGNQIKLMTVLLGTAGNGSFAVSEKWICDRTGMDQSNYNRARKALIEKGWLKLEDGHIYVDFDAIRRLPEGASSTHVGDMSSGNRGCDDHMPEACADNMHNIEKQKNHNIKEINSWAGKPAYLVQRTCRISPKKEGMIGFILWAIYEPILHICD